MDHGPLEVRILELEDGTRPFERWHRRLSVDARTDVDASMQKLRRGLLGDHRVLASGLLELRIHHGPGLRVYGGIWRGGLFIVAAGGSKKGQTRDIVKATALWLAWTKGQA